MKMINVKANFDGDDRMICGSFIDVGSIGLLSGVFRRCRRSDEDVSSVGDVLFGKDINLVGTI